MTYVLNTTASLLASNAAQAPTAATTGPTFWQRLYAAMIESRRRSALLNEGIDTHENASP